MLNPSRDSSLQLIILQSRWDALKSIPEIEKLHFQLEFICFAVLTAAAATSLSPSHPSIHPQSHMVHTAIALESDSQGEQTRPEWILDHLFIRGDRVCHSGEKEE